MSKNIKILFVEDELLISLAKSRFLAQHGYEVITEATGKAAIERVFSTNDIDLIIMDFDLGEGIDGCETAEQILKFRELPIIFFTSHSEPGVIEKIKKISRFGLVLKGSGDLLLLSSIEMACQLFEAHKKTKESELLSKQILDALPHPVFWKDSESIYRGCNKSFSELLGLKSPEEVIGKSDFELPISEENAKGYRADDTEIISNRVQKLHRLEKLELENQELKWLDTSKVPLTDSAGRIKGVVGVFNDVTSFVNIEEKSKLMASLLDIAPAAITVHDTSGNFIYANQKTFTLHGYEKDEFFYKNLGEIDVPEAVELIPFRMKEVVEKGELSFEAEHFHKNGDRIPFKFFVRTTDWNNKKMILSVGIDIRDNKKAESEIRRLLEEKNILISEIHHRVKNNMYTMASLLQFQAHMSKDEKVAETLLDARSRIQSMMVIYNHLFKRGNYKTVNIKEYLGRLIEEISDAFLLENISIVQKICDVELEVKFSFNLGIVVNELISNAVKHAFPSQKTGTIVFNVEKRENLLEVVIKNDGNLLPENFSLTGNSGFGLNLIKVFVDQNKGSIRFNRLPETEFIISFNLP